MTRQVRSVVVYGLPTAPTEAPAETAETAAETAVVPAETT